MVVGGRGDCQASEGWKAIVLICGLAASSDVLNWRQVIIGGGWRVCVCVGGVSQRSSNMKAFPCL